MSGQDVTNPDLVREFEACFLIDDVLLVKKHILDMAQIVLSDFSTYVPP